MLGKLFKITGVPVSGPGADNDPSSPPVSSLESVQEDIHTRNLVYPDAQALYQHRNHQVFPLPTASSLSTTSNTGAFDHDTNFELESRDIRIVILQDALGSMPASLLYDSQTPPPPPNSPDRPTSTAGFSHFNIEPRRTPLLPRRPSLGFTPKPVIVQPDSPQSRQGPFDRRQSIQARAQPRVESESQRAYREYTDELAVFSSCIFGSAELLAYKGTSTKVHVVPSEPLQQDLSSSIAGDGRGSLGRASMRASRLSQSFSSENVSPFVQAASSPPVPRPPEAKKVLITRLFPVTLPTVDDIHSMTPHSPFSEDSTGYPFPYPRDEAKSKKKRLQPKQKRTPMYAIALVINLPQAGSGTSSSKATMRGPGSYTEPDSFPSSYGSHQRSGWSMVSPSVAHDLGDPSSGVDTEERIDPITQHWDIIMRTLTHLQSVVATTIFNLLKHVDINSPDPFPSSVTSHLSQNSSVFGRRSEDGTSAAKPPKTNAKPVTLMPNCLMENLRIKTEVDTSRTRIVTGLRATRVVTGQNRWEIWREEARWVVRWAGEKDQHFFFKVLSGFLATHTEWLQALSPACYRRLHYQQEKAKPEDTALASRTILVARDKMAARRLLFLLSAFLPAHQQLPTLPPHRPSTSASWGTLGHSPPSLVVPILKEESLRRKLNRRAGNRQSPHSRKLSLQGQTARPFIIPGDLAHLTMDRRHERRPSDTTPIRTMNLPIAGSEVNRKSSAATMTSIASDATTAHLTRVQASDSQSHGRPGSSGGVAEDLKRTLRRGGSTGQYSGGNTDSNQSSRWGSMISGFWTRRRDSTNLPTHTREMSGVVDDVPISPTKSIHRQKTDTLSRMVREAQLLESPANQPPDPLQSRGVTGRDSEPQTPRLLTEASGGLPGQRTVSRESSQRIPNPAGAYESPVKTSINLEDGVIDVDVPFPEYITSFETAVSSPSSSGYLSTGLEAFEQSCRIDVESDAPPNVAGWLQQYHPDFVLQAIPPQNENLIEQIKASMRAEPSPAQGPLNTASDQSQRDRWLDISTALIADATTFKISRLRYRRLVRPKAHQEQATPPLSVSAKSYGNAGPTTPAVSPYEMHLEDEFIHEEIVTFDELLTDAVQRVIALGSATDTGADAAPTGSGRTSGLGLSSSSRSTSIRRGRSNSSSTEPENTDPITVRQSGPLLPSALPLPLPPREVPKGQCKTVVLSALEEIVSQVVRVREGGGNGDIGCANVLRAAVREWLENIENRAE